MSSIKTTTQRKVREILKQYGDRTSVSRCQRWFQKFRAGNYSLEDEPRSERSVELDKDANPGGTKSNCN